MTRLCPEVSSTEFDTLYEQSDDPWHIENRWYERRKRRVILAALPFEHADLIMELGCGTGVFSQSLAERCTRLLASDISAVALTLAQRRLTGVENIHLSCLAIPKQWPAHEAHSIDCIILSELGYYLPPAELPLLIQRIAASLKPSGILVASHWLADFPGRTWPTMSFHDALVTGLGMQTIVHHVERDFLLDVWSRDGCSVAMREGFA